MSKKYFLVLVLFAAVQVHGQKQKVKLKKADRQLVTNLQRHVQFLSADGLEGRRTGTAGEKKAAEYISGQFQALGLEAKGSNSFLQPFEVNEGKQIGTGTFLTIDGKALQLNHEFFPLAFSPDTTIEAMPSVSLQEKGMPWFADLKELLENDPNPHADPASIITNKAADAAKRGASALFIYNTAPGAEMKFDSRDRSAISAIPVVYLTRSAVNKYFSDPSAMLDIKLKTDLEEKTRTGSNVVGFINNGASSTIVLGAHFDHLGFGEDNNSRHTGDSRQIHNGADDNASGTAALIELARLLKASKSKNHNYLFIAFSGEELGLYGSKYFTENPTIELSRVNYMINMDMIGRLNDSFRLTVGGYGTSPSWGQVYNAGGKQKLFTGNMVLRIDSSGTGPSDHTSFYRKNIPVLFFFTGLHTDYHKPTDDADKINYTGQMLIVKHILSVIESTDRINQKLAFTKTREPQTTTTARFSVSLGIMPDYTFSGAGVRADGVTDGRPAQKAGIKAGDIITALNEYKIVSMESYMQALSRFKKGDKAVVTYTRGSETLSTTVEF
ncbi:MAG TPA: M20/M25/M40 family metallo-hydrolase [Flavisolibacter sp.]